MKGIGKLFILGSLVAASITPAQASHWEGHVDVSVPPLEGLAVQWQRAFNANCAQCQGENASGTRNGPPLIHEIYNPGHHNNPAIYRAMREGVRSHHWYYGNMPAQPQVGFSDAAAIVKFLRQTQEANGIEYQRHQMR